MRPLQVEAVPPATAGLTFPVENVGFIDFETRSATPIKNGIYRYATNADAIILSYAIGRADVRTIAVADFRQPLRRPDLPTEVLAHHQRVIKGEAIWAAWNAAFDRCIWNYAAGGFPEMAPHHIIDVMGQAVTSGLAPDLDAAAKQSLSERKQAAAGAKLIKLFCDGDGNATPATHPAEWQAFRAYAAADVVAMRSVYLGTRQLPIEEWREYWAMEAINERGIAIDIRMVSRAAALAVENRKRSRTELAELTNGVVQSVDQIKAMTAWLMERLHEDGRKIIIRRPEETDEDGAVIRPAKHQLTRRQVERLIVSTAARLDAAPELAPVLRVLQIRLYGGSKTPAKFIRLRDSHVDGVLFGQYVFNGAAQTGRASSRGVQIHNLARDALPNEREVLDAVTSGCSYDALTEFNADPVSRQLSLLIRPAFVPRGDNVFVWSDWSQIEARILPWLAGSEHRLQIFRDVDNDPSLPDLYTRTAATLSHVPIDAVSKPMRQRGKVAELALGYGGGVNALQAMGASYGLDLTDAEALPIVTAWRAANEWCVTFWKRIEDAVNSALKHPLIPQHAGRLTYVYLPRYLGGSLFCELPSGRCLIYRNIKYERVADVDLDDNPTGTYSTHLRFSRGHGRVKLWHGIFCENAVQAVAADVLRGTLVRALAEGLDVRAHTHDEVLVECSLADAEATTARLRELMQRGFDWSAGLPLMSEETISFYYTKHQESTWHL